MKLELGITYTVLKADRTIITFKFVGGQNPDGEVDGVRKPLYDILSGGYLSYWETDSEQ